MISKQLFFLDFEDLSSLMQVYVMIHEPAKLRFAIIPNYVITVVNFQKRLIILLFLYGAH